MENENSILKNQVEQIGLANKSLSAQLDVAKQMVNETLQSENKSLRDVIEKLVAEKQVLRQTLNDILEANLNLKSAGVLLEKQANQFNSDVIVKTAEINKLKENISELNAKLLDLETSIVNAAP